MTLETPVPESPQTEEERQAARDAALAADYCAGIKPLRQLGSEYGMSHTAVRQWAQKRGLTRDLQAAIRAKAEAKVSKDALSADPSKTRNAETEAAVIEANAQVQFNVRIAHRKTLGRLRTVADGLLSELEAQAIDPEELMRQLVDLAHPTGEGDDGNDRRQRARIALQKVMGSAGRTATARTLAEMVEKVIRMERQAFGIDAGSAEDNPASAQGAAAAAAAGQSRALSDAERAIRLARLLAANPGAQLPGASA